MENYHQEKDWINTTASVAPAVLGAAAGILVADVLSDRARKPVGLSLACLGLAAITPLLVGSVMNKVSGPETKRGSQRTLRGIRDGGIPARDISYLDEALIEDELGVG